MLQFATDNPLFRRIGLALLLLQLNIFIFTLPPFQAGTWPQTEPVMLALFLFAVLNSLLLALGVAKRWLTVLPLHPLWLCLILWVGWQCMATLVATSPWRSWFGPPHMGEGTGWHMALLLMVMLAYPVWQIKKYRHIVLGTMALGILLQCSLHLLSTPEIAAYVYNPEKWVPAPWASYLAFMMGYFWIATTIEKPIKNAGLFCLLIVMAYAVLFTSNNRTAILLLAGSMVVSVVVQGLQQRRSIRRFFYPNRTWKTLTVLACVLPIIGWTACSPLFLSIPLKGNTSLLAQMLDKETSIGQRLTMNRAGLATIQNEPNRLLMGDGWGRFTDDLFKYVLADDIYVFKNGKADANSPLSNMSAFHSHNQPLEALLSLGLTGMLLWIALPIIALWSIPRRFFWHAAPMVVGLALFSCFWFELPQVIPYQAIGLAALCSLRPHGWYTRENQAKRVSVTLIFISMVMGISSWQQWKTMEYGSRLYQATLTPPTPDIDAWVGADIPHGGDVLSTAIPYYIAKTLQRQQTEGVADRVAWYERFMDLAHQMSLSPHIGARAGSMEFIINRHLLADLQDPAFDPLLHKTTVNFLPSILTLMRHAPLRDDLTTIFLLNLVAFTHGDINHQVEILQTMLNIAPNNRGVLWVLGHILLRNEPTQDTGQEMIQRALVTHVEHIYPITDKELEKYK